MRFIDILSLFLQKLRVFKKNSKIYEIYRYFSEFG